ncbi:hypothetical protein HMPREF1081_04885, partial [[Clostridium] clostridioforme 90A4]
MIYLSPKDRRIIFMSFENLKNNYSKLLEFLEK